MNNNLIILIFINQFNCFNFSQKEKSFCDQLILTLAQTKGGLDILGEVNPGLVGIAKDRLNQLVNKINK